MITKALFDRYNGRDVYLYTLENNNVKVGVLDFGGILNFIKLNTVFGEKNVCVGYKNVKSYLENNSYCGSTVGRVANRIASARFNLEGKEYLLSANEGKNCLHGGVEGFDKKFYEAEIADDKLILSLTSPDGDMGFPGNLNFSAEFSLGSNELLVKYRGKSDKTTLFAPTCHAYFNLDGGGRVTDTLLKINADYYTPVDEALIPLGYASKVAGTPFDFRELKKIGEDISGLGGKTYDVNFCLNDNRAAVAQSLQSGITMEIITDMPGVQLYVGEAAENSDGGGYGFCLEPQFFPNAVNVANFKTPLLSAGDQKEYFIRYLFGFAAD